MRQTQEVRILPKGSDSTQDGAEGTRDEEEGNRRDVDSIHVLKGAEKQR